MKLNMIDNYKYLIVRNWLAGDRHVNPSEISDAEVAKCIKSNKIPTDGCDVIIHTDHCKLTINGESIPYTEVYLEHNGQEYCDEVFN